MRLPPVLIAVLGVQIGSCAGFSIFSKRDGLRVLSPHGGDRLSTGLDIAIEWETSSDKKVKIELRKGPPDALTTVHNIACECGPDLFWVYSLLLRTADLTEHSGCAEQRHLSMA